MVLKRVWFIAGVMLLGHTAVIATSYPFKKPIRVESHVNLAPASPTLTQGKKLRQRTARDLPVIKVYEENIGPASRYLIHLLTKLGCHYRPKVLAGNVRYRGEGSQKELSFIQDPQVVVANAIRINLSNHAQEPDFMAQVRQGFGHGKVSNSFTYCFPVAGPFSFRDTWGHVRSGGRLHHAVDIFAWEGAAVYAITAGVIQTLTTFPEAGITLLMRGQDGRGYGYMHLRSYAKGIVEGKTLKTGEVIGYVGHTGVKDSAAHLHFQVYADHRLCKDELLNPYPFLVQLCHGTGVTDLCQHRFARIEDQRIKVNRLRVYHYPGPMLLGNRKGRRSTQDSSILVVKNY